MLATLSGIVFGDYNADGVRDAGEPGLAGWTVFLDDNDNGSPDPGEQQTITAADGSYTFVDVPQGQHVVREQLQPRWAQTAPAGGGEEELTPRAAVKASPRAAPVKPPASRRFSTTEIVVAFKGDDAISRLTARRADPRVAGLFDLARSSHLLTARGLTLATVALAPGVTPLAAVRAFSRLPGVTWAQPNYIYDQIDPRELTPNDPAYPAQWHHSVMKNDLAWDTAAGAGVVIAVADDGLSLSHPDLAVNVWVNGGEIPGNGVDDDGNGFIDDVNGWDFSSDDNDVTPSEGFVHGTHVAGIAAARMNNGIGIAGTAGAATLMPIRWFGSGAWTSTIVAASFRYAVDNGAKILSSSYNIDNFIGDSIYTSALQYVYDRGALYINSAGNMSTPNPARQAFDQVLLVTNTNSADVKATTSNYGWGIDLSSPGTGIYSTIPDDGYQVMNGTSMSAPNAAGAAGLIWSAHPTWTRDQVAAALIGSADNIDAANPALIGLLGAGRVNSFRAVTEPIAPPRIRALGLAEEGAIINSVESSFTLDIANVLDPSTVSTSAFELRGSGADGVFNTPDDLLVPISLDTAVAYGTNRLRFTIGATLLPDSYRFSATPILRDPFGQALDGNGDGAGGDPFVRTFHVVPLASGYSVSVEPEADLTGLHFGNRDTAAPRALDSVFEFETRQAVQFIFTKDVGAGLSLADLVLQNDTTGQRVDLSRAALTYDKPTRTATFTIAASFAALLSNGDYTASLAGVYDAYGNALAGAGELRFFVQAGDANRDRRVDVADLGILAAHWNTAGKTFSQGDFTYDGVVDVFDLSILASHWQQSPPGPPLSSAASASQVESNKDWRAWRAVLEELLDETRPGKAVPHRATFA